VRDLGGKRARGGIVGALTLPLLLELVDEAWSSFGAIGGSRCCLLEGSPRLSSCITMRHSVTDIRAIVGSFASHKVTSYRSELERAGQASFHNNKTYLDCIRARWEGREQIERLAQICLSFRSSQLVSEKTTTEQKQ